MNRTCLTALFVLSVAGAALGQGGDLTITSHEWTLIASKGSEISAHTPTQSDMSSLPCLSDNIRTRGGKKLSIPAKFQLVQQRIKAREGRTPQLTVKTFSYPRIQVMDTILNGKRGYFKGWARKEDAGIVEAQAIRVEMFLRLSEDNQFVIGLVRRYYREWAPEWCANDLKQPAIAVEDCYTMPIPKTLFTVETVREIPGETRTVEVPCATPQQAPVVVVPWNGSYQSLAGLYTQRDIATFWKTKYPSYKCPPPTVACPAPPAVCPPDGKPLPPPTFPPLVDTPPNNDENRPRDDGSEIIKVNRG